ncbi:MAG: hypothetical protein PWQ09_501 [Candidatus Cloacimonadota bacterium]|nr:hypothetical protein [Candidatus Cloacimonadota bacterium]
MKTKLLIFMIFLNLCFNLFSDETFEREYDLNPYIYPTTGDHISELTPRCLQTTPDGGYAVLMKIELTEGMVAHFCTALLKTDSLGNIQWFKMLTNDPTLSDFYIVMQGWYFARGFTVTNDGGFVIPITGDGYGEESGSFILKLDANGEYEWHTQLADETSPPLHYLNTIKQTSDGDFYAAGYRDYLYPSYLKIMEVVKLTAQGDTLWTKTYQDSLIYKNAYDIALTEKDKPLIVGHTWNSELNWIGFTLGLSYEGEIEWKHFVEEQYQCFYYNSILLDPASNQFLTTGICNNENQDYGIIIENITNNGIVIDNYFIESEYTFYQYLPSIVSDFNNYIVMAAIINNNAEICQFDLNNTLMWDREVQGSLCDGPEVLQKVENSYFACISIKNQDTLVITKMDENGNSTDVNDDVIVIQEPNLKAYPNPFNPIINFEVKAEIDDNLRIEIYNIRGQKIDEVTFINLQTVVSWNANEFASGVYLCNLVNKDELLDFEKILLIK